MIDCQDIVVFDSVDGVSVDLDVSLFLLTLGQEHEEPSSENVRWSCSKIRGQEKEHTIKSVHNKWHTQHHCRLYAWSKKVSFWDGENKRQKSTVWIHFQIYHHADDKGQLNYAEVITFRTKKRFANKLQKSMCNGRLQETRKAVTQWHAATTVMVLGLDRQPAEFRLSGTLINTLLLLIIFG